jgi:signal transduction histidine kinase
MISQMLLSGDKYRDQQVEMIQDIYNESVKIEKIVKEMLNFSKQKALTLENHDLKSIIDSCLIFVKKSFKERNIRLNVDYKNGLFPVYVDFRQIEQVFMNLLLNAMDAMPQGGMLSIRAEADSISEKNRKEADSQMVHNIITISDTGVGIPENNLTKIFDPFFTTKAHGTGLGLSIVYQILQNHNGSSDVMSSIGKGTQFIIKLPALAN